MALVLQGAGRGVVAQKDIAFGDLILWSQPLHVLYGPADEKPDPGHLVQLMSRPHETQGPDVGLLRMLFDGTPESTSAIPKLEEGSEDTPQQQQQQPASGAGHAAAGASSSDAVNGLPSAKIASIVQYNAFGDDYEDLGLAAMRGTTAQSQVGIWPRFSFFNHSCQPNTVHYVSGSSMIMRATEAIPAGSEVTISYLGREEFAPASE